MESVRQENQSNRTQAMEVLIRMKKIERNAQIIKTEAIASGVRIIYKINNKIN